MEPRDTDNLFPTDVVNTVLVDLLVIPPHGEAVLALEDRKRIVRDLSREAGAGLSVLHDLIWDRIHSVYQRCFTNPAARRQLEKGYMGVSLKQVLGSYLLELMVMTYSLGHSRWTCSSWHCSSSVPMVGGTLPLNHQMQIANRRYALNILRRELGIGQTKSGKALFDTSELLCDLAAQDYVSLFQPCAPFPANFRLSMQRVMARLSRVGNGLVYVQLVETDAPGYLQRYQAELGKTAAQIKGIQQTFRPFQNHWKKGKPPARSQLVGFYKKIHRLWHEWREEMGGSALMEGLMGEARTLHSPTMDPCMRAIAITSCCVDGPIISALSETVIALFSELVKRGALKNNQVDRTLGRVEAVLGLIGEGPPSSIEQALRTARSGSNNASFLKKLRVAWDRQFNRYADQYRVWGEGIAARRIRIQHPKTGGIERVLALRDIAFSCSQALREISRDTANLHQDLGLLRQQVTDEHLLFLYQEIQWWWSFHSEGLRAALNEVELLITRSGPVVNVQPKKKPAKRKPKRTPKGGKKARAPQKKKGTPSPQPVKKKKIQVWAEKESNPVKTVWPKQVVEAGVLPSGKGVATLLNDEKLSPHLQDLLFQLEEGFRGERTPSLTRFLEEMNLVRRIFEGSLIEVARHYEVEFPDETHELHRLIAPLLESKKVAENVRKTLFHYRAVAGSLSAANACVNYPFSSWRKYSGEGLVHERARALLSHVTQIVEMYRKEDYTHLEELERRHEQILQEGIHVVRCLLQALRDPEAGAKLQPVDDLTELFETLPASDPYVDKGKERDVVELGEVATLPKVRISSASTALAAIEQGIRWVILRRASSVQGTEHKELRTRWRNEALDHAQVYLLRLRDHLGHPRSPSKGVEALSLARRLCKEVTIAALCQVEHYDSSGVHVARVYRYKNNPRLLNRLLAEKQVVDPLPQWLAGAHLVLSYPYREDFSHPLRKVLGRVQKWNLGARALRGGFVPGTVKVPDRGAHERKGNDLVAEFDADYLFPALEGAFATLRKGFAMSTSQIFD